MDSELSDKILKESRRVYEYLLHEFGNRFDWLNLCEYDIDPCDVGLSTVLMDDYINYRFIDKFNREPELQDEWKKFFDFIEEMLCLEDKSLTEVIDTTILEVLASEGSVDLEKVLGYCGNKTRRSILGSVRNYYGRPDRADELLKRYSCR
ncbi:MAG: hypothetical protein J6X33_04915 [Clostridiales bacterium]|nr:hypothetical protein [Clostridiales bacterium]